MSSPIFHSSLIFGYVGLAEVIPDGGRPRDDVGLVAAVGDDVVRALLERQMLATEVPADVHQLHSVERAAAAPRRAGRMGRLAAKRGTCTDTRPVPSRSPQETPSSLPTCVNSATSTSLKSPARTKYAFVPTSSSAVPVQIRIVPGSFSRSMIFFTAMAAVTLSACSGVVPFAVTRRAFDHRRVVGDTGLLRRLRDAVDVGAEREHRLPGSPARHERGRNARDALLHGEAVLFEDVDQVAVGLGLLEAQLGEAEDLVDHLLGEGLHPIDGRNGLGLQFLGASVLFRCLG